MSQFVTTGDRDLEALVNAYCQKPSEDTLQQVVEAGAGLVHYFVARYPVATSKEDLVQAGYEGLIRALRRYDPERKTRFATYASHYIKGEIFKELQREIAYDKRPLLAEIQQKIYRVSEELRQSLQREPTLKEIAEAVNIDEKGVVQAMLAGSVPLEELDLSRIKNIRYESFRLPVEDQLLLREALGKLSSLQQKVIYLIFYQELTQTRVAEVLGTNQRKVSRLLKRSLEQLALHLAG